MKISRFLGTVAAALVVAVASTVAWAQGYDTNQVSSRWISVPASATNFGLTGDDSTAPLNSTPFPIVYFGQSYTSMRVSTNGFVNFTNGTANGCCSASGGPFASGNQYDGVLSVAWADDYGVSSGSTTAAIFTWTDGVAPNRKFIIAWTNWSMCCSFNGSMNLPDPVPRDDQQDRLRLLGHVDDGVLLRRRRR